MEQSPCTTLLLQVDYTVPDVIHDQVDFYLRHRMPFVMGTTGGDRIRIARDVQASGVPSVIAPNMGKQIGAFQVRQERGGLLVWEGRD